MTDHSPTPDSGLSAIDSPDGSWWRCALEAVTGSPWLWMLAPAAALVILLYYPVGMALVHQIDDDPDFALATGAAESGQSRAVAMSAALVLREVDYNSWTPNDPFFKPSWALDNMPNFQQGIVAAIRQVTIGLSTLHDAPELVRAAGLLKYPATVWMFDPRTSWAPTASTEKQYRSAARSLQEYNLLANGEPRLARNAGMLRALLSAVVADLDIASAAIERQVSDGGIVDLSADDAFYSVKGRLYAYSLILRELGWDFAPVLAGGELGAQWRQMLETLRMAAALDPLVVASGGPDATVLPNHLTAQGFYLLRARVQMDAITAHLAP